MSDRAGEQTTSPSAPSATERRTPLGPHSLVAVGLLSSAVHVLYEIGHGPTVVKLNREVQGLTNGEGGRVGVRRMAPAAYGIVALQRRAGGLITAVETSLAVARLALRAVAAWIFGLYEIAMLALVRGEWAGRRTV